MTAIFHDVHEKLQTTLPEHRIPGATMDEVMYADDTICISTDTRSMNKFLEEIEVVAEQYGLKLNKKKCEVMTTRPDANIHFRDNKPVEKKQEVKYLGVMLNQKSDYKQC